MITKEPYFKVTCDECGEAFPEGDSGGYQLADDEQAAKEMVRDYDGEVTEDGKTFCAACVEEKAGASS